MIICVRVRLLYREFKVQSSRFKVGCPICCTLFFVLFHTVFVILSSHYLECENNLMMREPYGSEVTNTLPLS